MLLLLLSCWIIEGITAEDPPTMHYRVKNSSICLQTGKSPPYETLSWRFNGKIIVHNHKVAPQYADKMDYNPKNLSLCINKLTVADGGIYKFSTVDVNLTESIEIHRLIVEETVPRPVIRMSAMPSNMSAGFCIVTVNCSVQDDWLRSVCDGRGCRPSSRSFIKVNISVSTDNSSVVCVGSNNVSTSNVSESTEATCFNKSNPEHEESSQPTIVIVLLIVVAVCVFVFLCAFIFFVTKRLFSTGCNHYQVQASTAQFTQSQPAVAQPQPVTRVSTSSSSQSEAFYENVDTTQPSQTSSPREESGCRQSQQVDTVYSVPRATTSHGRSNSGDDPKGNKKKTLEASTSEPVALDEAKQPTPIDTVYSVLQKPKHLQSQHHQEVKQD